MQMLFWKLPTTVITPLNTYGLWKVYQETFSHKQKIHKHTNVKIDKCYTSPKGLLMMSVAGNMTICTNRYSKLCTNGNETVQTQNTLSTKY